MYLSPEQQKEYDESGFLVFRDLFSKDEVEALQRDAELLASPKRGHPDANVIEKDGVTLRAAWAPEIDLPLALRHIACRASLGECKRSWVTTYISTSRD